MRKLKRLVGKKFKVRRKEEAGMKITTENTPYGVRVVLDYGDYQTWIDVENGTKSGMGDDRIYIAHKCVNGDVVDLERVAVNDEGYIFDEIDEEEVYDTRTVWFTDIDEDWGE